MEGAPAGQGGGGWLGWEQIVLPHQTDLATMTVLNIQCGD